MASCSSGRCCPLQFPSGSTPLGTTLSRERNQRLKCAKRGNDASLSQLQNPSSSIQEVSFIHCIDRSAFLKNSQFGRRLMDNLPYKMFSFTHCPNYLNRIARKIVIGFQKMYGLFGLREGVGIFRNPNVTLVHQNPKSDCIQGIFLKP